MNWNLDLKNRPTLQKTLAAIAALVVAAVGMIIFGGTEEKDQQVVEQLCTKGLDRVATAGGLEICTHGPDPKPAFNNDTNGEPGPAPASTLIPSSYYPQTSLCPGDGTSGYRIHIYVGAPADRPEVTDAEVAFVRRILGYAERSLHEADPTWYQKYNFYCADDTTPTITKATMPAIGTDGAFKFLDAITGIRQIEGQAPAAGIYHAFVFHVNEEYPYGGQGATMTCDNPDPTACDPGVDFGAFSMTSMYCCESGLPGATIPTMGQIFMHEVGHNMGAVQPAATHSTGNGWHCTDELNNNNGDETMCYDDGGDGITTANPIAARCPRTFWKTYVVDTWDCDNDFWDPSLPSAGYYADHWNVAQSPYLTKPRRK